MIQRTFKARDIQRISDAITQINLQCETHRMTVQQGKKRRDRLVVRATKENMGQLRLTAPDTRPIGGWEERK